MKHKNLKLPSLIAVAISALSACGGGLLDALKDGQVDATTQSDKSEFLGAWVVPAAAVTGCKQLGYEGGFYITAQMKYVISNDELVQSVPVYSDASCTENRGDLASTYTIAWTPLQYASRQNVVGVHGPLKSIKLSGKDITAQALQMSSSAAAEFKSVMDVVNGGLAMGKGNSVLSADGYPSELDEPSLFRSR